MTVQELLDDLEEKFVAAMEGRGTTDETAEALGFAEVESEKFCVQESGVVMFLLRHRELCATDPVHAQRVVSCATKALLKVLTNEVAPLWAQAEYGKRREATVEMQADWVQSEYPELSQ